ncbi:MAG: threonine/serine exporter family protein [Clostridiales bacterium]|nr:threonine/serine exporter family protein [Clostridiales bacterium]
MKENQSIKLAVLAGEIMLESGAETARVEDTMLRLMERSGLVGAEAFSTTTGLFASATGKNGEIITMIKRISARENNFKKVAGVNELSHKFVDGKINTAEALAELEAINNLRPYPLIIRILGASMASMCFAFMFGGTALHALGAFISAFLLQIPVTFLERKNIVIFLRNIAGGIIGAIFALLFVNLAYIDGVEYVIVGAIMPLLPGVALTNAIRDILDGNMLAGSARIMEALLTAIAIASGVGVVMGAWKSIFGGVLI